MTIDPWELVEDARRLDREVRELCVKACLLPYPESDDLDSMMQRAMNEEVVHWLSSIAGRVHAVAGGGAPNEQLRTLADHDERIPA